MTFNQKISLYVFTCISCGHNKHYILLLDSLSFVVSFAKRLKRAQRELPKVVGEALRQSGLSLGPGGGIEAVAVTNRPGLIGSLL